LVLNRSAFLELDCNFLWNDFPSLVRRKISLVTVAIRGHLGAGGAAVWPALVLDKKNKVKLNQVQTGRRLAKHRNIR
jgi:hypothetical protein